jgi:hypothetical protein
VGRRWFVHSASILTCERRPARFQIMELRTKCLPQLILFRFMMVGDGGMDHCPAVSPDSSRLGHLPCRAIDLILSGQD